MDKVDWMDESVRSMLSIQSITSTLSGLSAVPRERLYTGTLCQVGTQYRLVLIATIAITH